MAIFISAFIGIISYIADENDVNSVLEISDLEIAFE